MAFFNPAYSPLSVLQNDSDTSKGAALVGYRGLTLHSVLDTIAAPYSALRAYSIGDHAFYNGIYYRAIAASTGSSPDTNPANWLNVSGQYTAGRNTSSAVDDAVNVIHGHSGNHIVSDTHSCVIAGGGMPNRENVIGGNVANVNTGATNINAVPVLGLQSQFCLIGGGYDNVANGLANCIPVGQHCFIDVPADHGTITGGSVNSIADGSYNGIYGGSRNSITADSGGYSMIAGGGDNEIGGAGSHVFIGAGSLCVSTASQFSVIGGGIQNTLNSVNSSTIGGGNGNNIELGNATIGGGNGNEIAGTGQGCTISGGINNTAAGESSSVLGGRENDATANYSSAQGYRASATRAGLHAFANGYFAVKGDAQHNRIILKKTTTTATPNTLDDVAGGASIAIKANRCIGYKIRIVAHRSDVQGDNAMIVLEGIAFRGGSGTHTITALPNVTVMTAGAATWSGSLIDSAGDLRVQVTGEASKTIMWAAYVEYLEVVG